MILVDDRVGAKELEPYIGKLAKVKRLQFADAAFDGLGPDGEPVSIGDRVEVFAVVTGSYELYTCPSEAYYIVHN